MNDHDPSLEDLVDRATPDSAPPFGDVLARRGRRRTRRRATAGGVAAAAVVAAVAVGSSMLSGGASTDPDPAPPPTATATDTSNPPAPEQVAPDWDGEGVPPLTLMLADRMVVLAPFTYCYGNACVDGTFPEHLDDVGSAESVAFSFPLPDWQFEATFTQVGGGDCPRSITVPAERTSPTMFEIPPVGVPGAYKVSLFGQGDGDVSFAFSWTTAAAGVMPEPDGHLALLSVTGDETNVYGAELSLNDLASTPENATAEITLTDADGASRTLAPMHAERGCSSEGTLFFNGPDDLPTALGDIGPFPYTYSVKLTMDGEVHVGTAKYPDDEIKGLEPYTALTWDPPLPAYTG